MSNIGYIYKITNKVNEKCYIGQTSDSIEHRWKGHLYDSQRTKRDCYNYPLYRAFRKYGIENFSIEEIEKCNLENLDDREIYWISYFNSKKKGYNQLYGGSGSKRYNLDEQEVIERYNKLQNIVEVESNFNVPRGVVSRILRKHNVKVLSTSDVMKNKNRTVYQYDKDNNLINIFNSFTEAGKWLRKYNLSKCKNDTVAGSTVLYCLQRGKTECLGYLWKCVPCYSEEEIKHFSNRISKQSKLQHEREKLKKKLEPKQIKPKKEKKPKIKKISICPICGEPKASKSTLCKKCNENLIHNKSEQQREEKYGTTREMLKQQIREMPFLQVGKLYGVSDNAIRKWCKRYNLPSKSSEIRRYTDEEWENV